MIKSLSNTSIDIPYQAFSKAFADYKFQISKDQLQAMLRRRGFNPELSFAAFDGKGIVAFTFNGIGQFNQEMSAYDTGTGTHPDYRKKGLASEIFEYSIPYLKEAGVKQYLLEVLQENEKAISVYQKLGFAITRQLNYYNQTVNQIRYPNLKESSEIVYTNSYYNQIDKSFHDFPPSWQNSIDSISRSIETFKYLGAYHKTQLVGYCVTETATGDITQIAVSHSYRRLGIGSYLLQAASQLSQTETIKLVNTDPNCESLNAFLARLNIPLNGKQYEMVRPL